MLASSALPGQPPPGRERVLSVRTILGVFGESALPPFPQAPRQGRAQLFNDNYSSAMATIEIPHLR